MKTLLLILALSQPKKDSTWTVHHTDLCKCYCSTILYIRKATKEYEYLLCDSLKLKQGDKITVLGDKRLQYKGRTLDASFQRETTQISTSGNNSPVIISNGSVKVVYQ